MSHAWAIAGLLGMCNAVYADPPGPTQPIVRPCRCDGVYVEPSLWAGVDITPDHATSDGLGIAVGYFHEARRLDSVISEQLRIGAYAQVGSVHTPGQPDANFLGGELEINWILPGSQLRLGPRVAIAAGTNGGHLLVAGVRLRRRAVSLGFDLLGATTENSVYVGDTLTAGPSRTGVALALGYDTDPKKAAIVVGVGLGLALLAIGLLASASLGSR